MQYIIGFIVGCIFLYFLIIGGILVWPILNIILYLKVLIFPWPVRKKYGTSIENLTCESFDIEFTGEDINQLKRIKSLNKNLNRNLQDLQIRLKELGVLKRNKDGSISQRSKVGKEGKKITKEIKLVKKEINANLKEIKSRLDKPWSTWCSWSQRYGRYLGNRDAIFFMAIGFPIFFLILSQLNPVGLDSPAIERFIELYVYMIFIAPLSIIFEISIFNSYFFSFFISFDEAMLLTKNYAIFLTPLNWIMIALPMPLLTLIFYYFSRVRYVFKTRKIRPNTKHWDY